ncbi:hypothetical protein pb186bvf_011390 [Paramecium bursaria]
MNINQQEIQNEIRQFLVDTEWQQQIQDVMLEIEQAAPSNPWIYLLEQPSSIGHQLHHIDIKQITEDNLKSRILELLVDYHQITKLRKATIICIVQCILLNKSQQIQQTIIKYVTENVEEISNLDKTVLILCKVLKAREISEQVELMKRTSIPITWAILSQFFPKLPNSNELYSLDQLFQFI